MESSVIHAEPRTRVRRGLNQLRREGLTPLVLYGKTVPPRALQARTRALEQVVQASGMSHLLEIRIGTEEKIMVLLREIQRHPVRHHLLHVDAYALQMDEKQTLQIPIVTMNEPDSNIAGDLVVVQNLDVLTVEAYPNRIPEAIPVDLSQLTMDHNILVRNVATIPDVDFLHGPDEVIFSLTRSAAADAEAADAAEMAAEIGEPEIIGLADTDEE